MSTSFPCPACGNKRAFEIIREGKDGFSATEGAICAKCSHVITQEELDDLIFTFAAKRIKKALKKCGTGFE